MFFILLANIPLKISAENKSEEVLITNIDNSQLSGERIAVKPGSILILHTENGKDTSILVNDILAIKFIKRAKPLREAGFGLLGRAAAGFCYGAINPCTAEPKSFLSQGWGINVYRAWNPTWTHYRSRVCPGSNLLDQGPTAQLPQTCPRNH